MGDFDTPAAHVVDAAPRGYVEYEIDVEKVLRDELPGVIERAEIAPLTLEAIAAVPELAKGAYVLFENGHPVYAGKTDTRHGFRSRLSRHFRTIQDRIGLDPTTIGFKAVRIMVFSNFDVEAILIDELRRKDSSALRWNFSGFGSNDPGHNREAQEPADFDKERPVDIDRPLDFLPLGSMLGALDLALALKDGLTYLFRYETDLNERGRPKRHTVGHVDFREAAPMTLPEQSLTMREALILMLEVLPNEWRATVFPDRVILYREKVTYKYAREYLEFGQG
jgi:hypothetical protein